jgi:hypothetical protein
VSTAPHAAPGIEPNADVLTWRLARRVMVDHEFDLTAGDGRCRCCGQAWPCGAWRRADDIANLVRP